MGFILTKHRHHLRSHLQREDFLRPNEYQDSTISFNDVFTCTSMVLKTVTSEPSYVYLKG